MTSIKKNIITASSALILTALLAGCNTNNERPSSFSYDYGYVDTSTTSDISSDEAVAATSPKNIDKPVTTVSQESNTASEPETGSSKKKWPDVVCTVSIGDNSSSLDDSKPEPPKESKPSTSTPSSNSSSGSSSSIKVSGSVDAIKQICGLKSEVEIDIGACLVDTYNDHNPYDVEYNYGKVYDAFVDTCDWSLVFDADFYAKSFPLLAMQYHNDKNLLLEHFQTIGIHEGRQGNKNFNVGVYKANCGSDVKSAFGDNYEGYCFYYMLNYSSEKSVSTAPTSNSKIQQKTIMTALQAAELDGVNKYRKEVGVFEIKFDSELAAYANYRAYLNAHDGYKAHDWLHANHAVAVHIMSLYNAKFIGENTVTNTCHTPSTCTSYECNHGGTRYADYRTSESHYKAMIDLKHDLIGCGNCYKAKGVISQFDAFINL